MSDPKKASLMEEGGIEGVKVESVGDAIHQAKRGKAAFDFGRWVNKFLHEIHSLYCCCCSKLH